MSKDTETIKRDAEAAQFRFALIAPVIQGLFPDTSATAYYKRVTASPLTLPDGSIVSYSYKTLEKWKSQYKIGGLDALMPNTRSDKWFSRALNEEAIAIIYRRILMYSSFYGLTFNPFDKQQLKEKDHFISRDFTEMTNWLNYPSDSSASWSFRGNDQLAELSEGYPRNWRFYCPPRNGKIVCPSLLRRQFKSKPVPY